MPHLLSRPCSLTEKEQDTLIGVFKLDLVQRYLQSLIDDAAEQLVLSNGTDDIKVVHARVNGAIQTLSTLKAISGAGVIKE
jgi:hypothetical protein